MVAEFPLDREGLRKALKKGREAPLAFGYNPGTLDDHDEWLAVHRTRKPEFLGRMALHEGAGTRSAYGTFTVLGAEIRLTCERTIPELARKFKAYLKWSRLPLNVVVLDPEGNVIDSDVEALDEWFDEADDDGDEAVQDAAEDAVAEALPVPDRAAEGRALAARLAAVRDEVAAAAGDLAPRIRQGFAGAVALVKAGELEAAEKAVSQLELVLARLAHLRATSVAPPSAAPPSAAPQPAARPGAPPASGGAVKAASNPAAGGGRGRAPAAAPLPASDPRRARIDRAARLLRAALSGLPKARSLLSRIDAAEAQAARGQPAAAAEALRKLRPEVAAARAQKLRWQRAERLAAPLVARVVAERSVLDPAGLRKRWKEVAGYGEKGDHAKALEAMPDILARLRRAPSPSDR